MPDLGVSWQKSSHLTSLIVAVSRAQVCRTSFLRKDKSQQSPSPKCACESEGCMWHWGLLLVLLVTSSSALFFPSNFLPLQITGDTLVHTEVSWYLSTSLKCVPFSVVAVNLQLIWFLRHQNQGFVYLPPLFRVNSGSDGKYSLYKGI